MPEDTWKRLQNTLLAIAFSGFAPQAHTQQTDAASGRVGEAFEFGQSHSVTLHSIEARNSVTIEMMGAAEALSGYVVDAEICAGDVALNPRVPHGNNFGLLRSDDSVQHATAGRAVTIDGEPAFYAGMAPNLAPGECERGLIAVRKPARGPADKVVFDTRMFANALPEGQVVFIGWPLVESG